MCQFLYWNQDYDIGFSWCIWCQTYFYWLSIIFVQNISKSYKQSIKVVISQLLLCIHEMQKINRFDGNVIRIHVHIGGSQCKKTKNPHNFPTLSNLRYLTWMLHGIKVAHQITPDEQCFFFNFSMLHNWLLLSRSSMSIWQLAIFSSWSKWLCFWITCKFENWLQGQIQNNKIRGNHIEFEVCKIATK